MNRILSRSRQVAHDRAFLGQRESRLSTRRTHSVGCRRGSKFHICRERIAVKHWRMQHSDRWLDSVRRERTLQNFLSEPVFVGRKMFAAFSAVAIRNRECGLRIKY